MTKIQWESVKSRKSFEKDEKKLRNSKLETIAHEPVN